MTETMQRVLRNPMLELVNDISAVHSNCVI